MSHSPPLLPHHNRHLVGKHSEQIKDFHNAQDFVASLRVENNDQKADTQW